MYVHAEAAVLPAGAAVVPVAEVVDARPVADAPVELRPLLRPPAGTARVVVERVTRQRRVERGHPVGVKVVSGRVRKLPDMMSAKFLDYCTPSPPMFAFESDLYNKIHTTNFTTSASTFP